jgi:hypothetical protein
MNQKPTVMEPPPPYTGPPQQHQMPPQPGFIGGQPAATVYPAQPGFQYFLSHIFFDLIFDFES